MRNSNIMLSIGVFLYALIAAANAAYAGYAADFKGDNSACWGDNERQDISCTQLTEKFFMSMRFATRAQIQKAMNAAGREIVNGDRAGLHFISNYTRGSQYGSGYINFTFDKDGKVVIMSGYIDSAYGVDPPDARFIWNAELLPNGCFDGPNTKMHHC
jgi:hypothetical protein